jgi:hypothetical protein
MAFPIKICVVCQEEFELKPGKPGFANRCPQCSVEGAEAPGAKGRKDAVEAKNDAEMNAARRQAIRQMLYSKDS